MKHAWKIGEMAAALGTTPKTLRHYESVGLLGKPVRSVSGYRLYDDTALRRATIVIGLRRLGLNIDEVRAVTGPGNPDAGVRHRLAEILDEKIRNADEELAVLQGRREDLAVRQTRLVVGTADECLCTLLSMPCHCGQAPRS